MTTAWRLGLGLGVLGLAAWSAAALAGGPLDKLLTASRVEADPGKNYDLTERNGPWMILACTFMGEGARQQAHDLVVELRKRYKLPAYVYAKRFELGKETFGAGIDRFGNPQRMKYKRGSEFEEFAVMIGDYPTIDDPEAQETLRRLKYCEPESLKPSQDKKSSRTLAALRWFQKEVLPQGNDKKKRGPMGHAFVTTNPLVPKEFFAPKGLDQLVIKANEGVKHCLLDCPGKYTVQVAHFTGSVVIKPEEVKAIQTGHKEMNSQLAEAALMAHRLTEALRMKGYEAYEFHDRYASLVTVGSFDWIDHPGADGKREINPAALDLINQIKGKTATGQVEARALVGIPFDPQPIPVHVPRRSLGAVYARDAVGGGRE